MGVCGQRQAPAALPPGKKPGALYRRLSRPKVRPGRVRKISPPPAFDFRTLRPPASCYTDYAIMCEGKVISLQTGVAQRVGRGIALLFHDRGTRRGWVVSSTLRPYFTPGKDPVPILQEAGWAPGPVCAGEKSRPRRDSIPNHPARSQSLYRLSYPLCCHGPRISTRTSHISWPFLLKVGEIFT